MRYLLCLSLLAAPTFSVACTNGTTWYEQADCRNQQIANEETALTQAVSAYSATLSPRDKGLFAKSQAAWKAYSDATCAFAAEPVAGGSLQSTYVASCWLALSEQRRLMLENLANCEKTSERTVCLTRFSPRSAVATGTVNTDTKTSSTSDDIDRLTTYGVALGKGIACKAPGVDDASRRVGKWMDEHFKGSDKQAYLPVMIHGIEANVRMQSEQPVESCDSVRASFASFPWP
ncbi:DUF1311 domain-containing protein [Pseudomonas sp. PDM21]|uniref:lysozyme inhibitor LprI family protein n=1 Tax=Pseudomonas sp. PDM21 TaxID=2769257 RepID=UPI001781786B|nr:lysozyme inhibitor LprI family protein [Pseudomonas sp. PDM21]MBD9672991.1 DUF1311 domain-containing protein [Pseudomonas sp. PDM21]